MYSSCIFCNAPLGANELLERFPVGRRIAYDERAGRLWAVCRKCERWNLSPLETRWEAIEDAERLFRATSLKVSGENISLAQTAEGLELVRVGSPPRVELMAWRYGDQFGRRRRRHLIAGTGVAAGAAAFGVASFMTSSLPVAFALLSAVGGGINMANTVNFVRRRWVPRRVVVRDDAGKLLQLNSDDVAGAALVSRPADGWRMAVPHRVQIGRPGKGAVTGAVTELTGDAALLALSRLLPLANRDGGSRRHLMDAMRVIDNARTVEDLVRRAATNDEARKTHIKVKPGWNQLGILPPRLRLALEMALHEADERRAMEGELAELETRWREADALAKIADSLLLPPEVEQELEALRRRR
jgi:hypothetical protein